VATVCDNPVYGETAYERARLIAAAPEMREALETAHARLKHCNSYAIPDNVMDAISDALDAARGG